MADTTLASILNALGQNIRPVIVTQFNRRARFLRLIPFTLGDGKNLAWDIESDGATTENHADGDDVSAFSTDTDTAATLQWGLCRSNFAIGDQAIAAARANKNPGGLIALGRRRIMGAATKLTSRLNYEAYSGTGTGGQMAGLCSVALRTDNTYAGIDRTDSANAFWRSNITDLAGAPISLDAIREMIGVKIYEACGEEPDVALCGAAAFKKVGALFDATRRQSQDVTIETPRGQITLKGGLGVIDIDGTVLIKDKDVPSGEIVFVNTQYVEGEYLPLGSDENLPENAMTESANDGWGALPLGFDIKELGRSGAKRKFTMMSSVQIKVTRPNACGRIINLG